MDGAQRSRERCVLCSIRPAELNAAQSALRRLHCARGWRETGCCEWYGGADLCLV